MLTTIRRSLALTALTAAFAAPLAAQDLDVQVVRDETIGMATYTATVSAPPRSNAFLLLSLGTLPAPLPIPTVFGPLVLDPLSLFAFPTPIAVGPLGTGQLRFTTPLNLTEGLEIPFQALVVDPRANAALTPLASATHGTESQDFGMSWVGSYDSRTGDYRMRFWNAAGGDTVEMKVNGQIVASGTVDPSGVVELEFRAQLRRGDRVSICRNGEEVKSWLFC